MPGKVLVVDDEKLIVKGLKFSLEQDGMEVSCAYDGEEAVESIRNNDYDMVLLDVMLPKLDGLLVCQQVREFSNVPIIMLTAKGDDMDKILGLEYGADDYITKPFSLLVLISKVNACMRRTEKQSGQILISGDLEVHCHTMQVYRNRDAIVLSKKEIQLLICLMEHAGTVLTKEQILERVWDKDGQFVDDNTVTVNISRLKNKLDTNAIENIRGLGYIWTGTVTKK